MCRASDEGVLFSNTDYEYPPHTAPPPEIFVFGFGFEALSYALRETGVSGLKLGLSLSKSETKIAELAR